MGQSVRSEFRRRLRARQYGGIQHRTLRANLEPVVAAGLADCALCGHRIAAGARWDLAHAEDRRFYLGPAHERCNRATNPAASVERTSREW